MCCIFTVLVFLGPRAGILLWWLADQARWSRVYDTFIIPALGFVFLPWTTLMYAAIYNPVTGMTFFEWLLIGLAVIVDIASYSGGAYGNRNRIPGYATS